MNYNIEQAQDQVIKILIENDHHQLTFTHLQSLLERDILRIAMLKPMLHKLIEDGMVTEDVYESGNLYHPTLKAKTFLRDGGYSGYKAKNEIKEKRDKWTFYLALIAAIGTIISIAISLLK